MEARWFFAHKKDTNNIDIDVWCLRLHDLLKSPGWTASVTSGRDDYNLRARAMGGWHRWCVDVPTGIRWDGDPLFHGVVVPSSETSPFVGRATSNLVEGFLRAGKHAYLLCPQSEKFNQIMRVEPSDSDSWQAWATLISTE